MKGARMKRPKPKKPRPVVLREPPAHWNLGRVARFTVTEGTPTPAFLRQMIVKTTDHQGGSQ